MSSSANDGRESDRVLGSKRTGDLLARLDLHRRVLDANLAWRSLVARSMKSLPGWPPGSTRWQVNAVCVVLIGQIWRSWT